MKKILILLIILPITSCVTLTDDEANLGSFSPNPMFLRNMPQGNDNYSLGFRDGCYNMIGQAGFGLVRLYDRAPNPDGNLMIDELYQQGYSHGDRYCGVYVNKGIIL